MDACKKMIVMDRRVNADEDVDDDEMKKRMLNCRVPRRYIYLISRPFPTFRHNLASDRK